LKLQTVGCDSVYNLEVHSSADSQVLTCNKNARLIDLLRENNINIRKGCSGNGACGLCKIKVIKGSTNELTESEKLHLSQKEINTGIRLACQVTLNGNLEIRLIDSLSFKNWKFKPTRTQKSKQWQTFPIGIAVDLGTTHIRLSTVSLKTGERFSMGYCLNPQLIYGSDIMTRLQSAAQSENIGEIMSQALLETIGEGLWRSCLEIGIGLDVIKKIFLVGNTAMITLLVGKGHGDLLQPENWHRYVDTPISDADHWKMLWGLSENVELQIIPSLSGFVGSDLLAGIISTNLMAEKQKKLLVDFGTNSEIALWDASNLWITSAAGGPAFEGSGMSCGMPAENGAIYQTVITEKKLDYKVIGHVPAKGFCGSGTVALIADLLKLGIVLPTGGFSKKNSSYYKLFDDKDDTIKLTKRDIDLFQRAKSAVATGIMVLLKEAGINFNDLDTVYLGGAFGGVLDIEKAAAVGLIPPVNPRKVFIVEDMALKGCEQLLLELKWTQPIDDIKEKGRALNLSKREDFYELFLQNLFLTVFEGEV